MKTKLTAAQILSRIIDGKPVTLKEQAKLASDVKRFNSDLNKLFGYMFDKKTGRLTDEFTKDIASLT